MRLMRLNTQQRLYLLSTRSVPSFPRRREPSGHDGGLKDSQSSYNRCVLAWQAAKTTE